MRIVVALGGNALLRRGQPLTAAAQQGVIGEAAGLLAGVVAAGHQLVVTHGNGPQVGLLALQAAAGPPASVMPLDVLGAESEGWIGYAIELALRNALPEGEVVVTVLTQTRVDIKDEAFFHPSKPIGPVYDEATAKRLAMENDWSVAADGKYWRRVVASPKPLDIVEIAAIRRLVDGNAIVICAGGGGIPVCKEADGKFTGIEAVIDKDATAALLAEQLQADFLIMLTDVANLFLDFGMPGQRSIAHATPKELEAHAASFSSGSMGPKAAAACRFVRGTGRRAAIGALCDLRDIIAGTKGTLILPEGVFATGDLGALFGARRRLLN